MLKCKYCGADVVQRRAGNKVLYVTSTGRLHVCDIQDHATTQPVPQRPPRKSSATKRYKKKYCKKCGLELGFRKLPSGKWCPTNPDGSDHWDLCRKTQWKKGLQEPEQYHLAGVPRRKYITKAVGVTEFFDEDWPPWFASESEYIANCITSIN